METVAFSKKNNNYYEYTPFLFKDSNIIERNNFIVKDLFDSLQMEILIDGRFELNIGDKIKLEFPSKVSNVNKVYNGLWIVMKINHIFSDNSVYTQKILIVKDYIDTYDLDRVVEKK